MKEGKREADRGGGSPSGGGGEQSEARMRDLWRHDTRSRIRSLGAKGRLGPASRLARVLGRERRIYIYARIRGSKVLEEDLVTYKGFWRMREGDQGRRGRKVRRRKGRRKGGLAGSIGERVRERREERRGRRRDEREGRRKRAWKEDRLAIPKRGLGTSCNLTSEGIREAKGRQADVATWKSEEIFLGHFAITGNDSYSRLPRLMTN